MDSSTSYFYAAVAEFERQLILFAWKRCGTLSEVAVDLGLNKRTLHNKMNQLGIKHQKGELICGANQPEVLLKIR
jgi:DNA-binding NtrC family response regulator